MSAVDPAADEDPIVAAINAAEEISDPLDGVVEMTTADPGAPFVPEVLESLAALKKEDRAAFEALRAQLKKAGCRVTALDEAVAEESGDVGGRGAKQADILIELAQAATLFHAPDGTGYANVEVNGHRETLSIRRKAFKQWLCGIYFRATRGAPNSDALQSALNVIEAKAHYESPERVVHIRVGELDGRLYLDLCDERWRAVEIDINGWRVVDSPPVRFCRAAGMKPLLVPVPGGKVDALRTLLNVASDDDFVLVVAWALACLRDRGPYPVLVLSGEQGSAKSTFSSILRALLDPNTAPLRALPRENRDLFIAAINGHVLTFDNVSGLPPWISDTICRLATGGGFAVRQLYTDQDEILFNAARPVILNSIDDIITRPDLADRALILTLEPIPEERRRPEAELWAAVESGGPRILGALLDAVVVGLKRLPDTHLETLPRMADFAVWATACETALWEPGTFWAAYSSNRDEAVENVISADPVAVAVRGLMEGNMEWKGTATTLLNRLAELAGDRTVRSKAWPGPQQLSNRLRRAATFLRSVGIEISNSREGHEGARIIRITKAARPPTPEYRGQQPSASSASSASMPKPGRDGGFVAPDRLKTADDADGTGKGDAPVVSANWPETNGADGADDADAFSLPNSASEEPGTPGWRWRL